MEFLAGAVVGLVLGIVGTLLVGRLRQREAPRVAAAPKPADGQSELARLLGAPAAAPREAASPLAGLQQKLRAMILHDPVTEERLIQAERERAPEASQADLYQAAIARLERDRR
ncbi:MAG: hypothetical protein FJ290_09445 [Planctomycetes bacterium]|nr:hypothetical protein [Planctomycetota bacterium]